MQSNNRERRLIIGRSAGAVFVATFLFLPLLLYPLALIFGGVDCWPLVFMELPWFLFFYFVGCNVYFGYVSFSDDHMVVRTNKPHAFEEGGFAFVVPCKDILSASFVEKDGDRNDEVNRKVKAYSVPILELELVDGSKLSTLLPPFSRKQWLVIEAEIIKRNPDVCIRVSAKDLLRRMGGKKK